MYNEKLARGHFWKRNVLVHPIGKFLKCWTTFPQFGMRILFKTMLLMSAHDSGVDEPLLFYGCLAAGQIDQR